MRDHSTKLFCCSNAHFISSHLILHSLTLERAKTPREKCESQESSHPLFSCLVVLSIFVSNRPAGHRIAQLNVLMITLFLLIFLRPLIVCLDYLFFPSSSLSSNPKYSTTYHKKKL